MPSVCSALASNLLPTATVIVLETRAELIRKDRRVHRRGWLPGAVHALAEMTPAQIVQEVSEAACAGGWAGYPRFEVGHGGQDDWDNEVCHLQRRRGDPGAFMDRSVLESDPHRVLEE